jgi:hypothetical protein
VFVACRCSLWESVRVDGCDGSLLMLLFISETLFICAGVGYPGSNAPPQLHGVFGGCDMCLVCLSVNAPNVSAAASFCSVLS